MNEKTLISSPLQTPLSFNPPRLVHKWSFINATWFPSQYNIKKKEEIVEQPPQEEPNPLMRKKKTPEELAAEAEQEDLDDFTSKCP